jgi:hypothetical protein
MHRFEWAQRRAVWFAQQWEWLKSFFDEDAATKLDAAGHNPSHKNLIALTLTLVFCISYLKKVWQFGQDDDLPDIPQMWCVVFLGILGIRMLQEGANAFLKSKNGNGNGNGNGQGSKPG